MIFLLKENLFLFQNELSKKENVCANLWIINNIRDIFEQNKSGEVN